MKTKRVACIWEYKDSQEARADLKVKAPWKEVSYVLSVIRPHWQGWGSARPLHRLVYTLQVGPVKQCSSAVFISTINVRMHERKAGFLRLLGSSKRRHSLGRKCRWRDLSTKQRDEGGLLALPQVEKCYCTEIQSAQYLSNISLQIPVSENWLARGHGFWAKT